MKKEILFAVLLTGSISVLGQKVHETGTNVPTETIPNFNFNTPNTKTTLLERFYLPFMSSNRPGFQPQFQYSGQTVNGFPLNSTQGSMRTARLNFPVHFRYRIANGVSLQAGSQMGGMMGGKQARLGANFNLPMGVNLSAGYGAGFNNLNRLGYGPGNRTQGLQITAGYRFRK